LALQLTLCSKIFLQKFHIRQFEIFVNSLRAGQFSPKPQFFHLSGKVFRLSRNVFSSGKSFPFGNMHKGHPRPPDKNFLISKKTFLLFI